MNPLRIACLALPLLASPAPADPPGQRHFLDICAACHDPPGPDGRDLAILGRSLEEITDAQSDIEEMRDLNTPAPVLAEIAAWLATLPPP